MVFCYWLSGDCGSVFLVLYWDGGSLLVVLYWDGGSVLIVISLDGISQLLVLYQRFSVGMVILCCWFSRLVVCGGNCMLVVLPY